MTQNTQTPAVNVLSEAAFEILDTGAARELARLLMNAAQVIDPEQRTDYMSPAAIDASARAAGNMPPKEDEKGAQNLRTPEEDLEVVYTAPADLILRHEPTDNFADVTVRAYWRMDAACFGIGLGDLEAGPAEARALGAWLIAAADAVDPMHEDRLHTKSDVEAERKRLFGAG